MPKGRPKKEVTPDAEKLTSIMEEVNMEEVTSTDNSFGPSLFKRDEHGLLENAKYTFNEDGSINWRSMVKEEHLFPNKAWFERFKKPIPKTIDGLKDHQLLIKLSGIKELARLRGFDSVSYEVSKCELNHVAAKCSVSFIPNYETGGRSIFYEDMANATTNNCSSFAVKFLETIACNRSFVRAVRNFLNIHIVGLDEMDTSDSNSINQAQGSSQSSLSIQSSLEKNAKDLLDCVDFDDFLTYLKELKDSNSYICKEVESWSSFSDIPSKEARVLLKLIKETYS
jgi:hypothetical protein